MFKNRSTKKEMLDGDVAKNDLIQNLKELHKINTLLGGYSVSINAFKKLDLSNKTILDIGSGGGDMLNEIKTYCKARNLNCQLVGLDLKQDCVDYAQQHLDKSIRFVCDDYRNAKKAIDSFDILHACLFTHHLSDKQIVELLSFARINGCVLVINDLHRNFFAYHSIKILTSIFSKSRLVKNDAPLSVLRGFTKKEWVGYFQKAGIPATEYCIRWKWAFRHQIIIDGKV